MDARNARWPLATAYALILLFPYTVQAAGSARSQNFVVSAPTRALAEEIAATAERQRRELAVSWLGHELPPWQDPCPIQANVDPRLGAGGATAFLFETESRQFSRPVGDGLFQSKPAGRPFGWEMTLQGSRERVLDSVLPHEITHTIFATHFGRPLPRWADEGACTTVEHDSEKEKQHRMLYEFLTTERGIPFNRMFSMTEYPQDILPLYSQGYSLARFLIQQGGRRKFVNYIGDGLNSNNWTEATDRHYGYASISDLQLTWLDWVRNGSQTRPTNVPETSEIQFAGEANPQPARPASSRDLAVSVASNTTSKTASNHAASSHPRPNSTVDSANTRTTTTIWIPREPNFVVATAATTAATPQDSSPNRAMPTEHVATSLGSETSWYARQRERTNRMTTRPAQPRASSAAPPSPKTDSRVANQWIPRVATRPDSTTVRRDVILQWGSPSQFLQPRLEAPQETKNQ